MMERQHGFAITQLRSYSANPRNLINLHMLLANPIPNKRSDALPGARHLRNMYAQQNQRTHETRHATRQVRQGRTKQMQICNQVTPTSKFGRPLAHSAQQDKAQNNTRQKKGGEGGLQPATCWSAECGRLLQRATKGHQRGS